MQDTDLKPQYARAKHAADHFKISKSTLWSWLKRPGCPQPLRASAKVTLFDINALTKYLEAHASK